MNGLIKIFSNKPILYVISRYATYIIQFINSLLIAIYLGPVYLGIWGFINLVIGYINQFNFGIPNSVNVIISVKKQEEVYIQKIIANGTSIIIGLSFFISLFFLISKITHWDIGNKYHINDYIVPLCIIAILTHLNSYFSMIFRVYGKIFAIAINQSLFPLMLLFVIPFFRGESLLWVMLVINCISVIVSFILFFFQRPFPIRPCFDWKTVKYILHRGWHLFVYNASFYLILLTTRTFISGNYSIKEFGYFTFSYSLANAILLFLDSISFLVFPKMLNRFALSDNSHNQEILESMRTAYISLSHLMIHFVIMVFPLFIYFFPDYQQAPTSFRIIALTVVLYTNSFGYPEMLMAKGYEKHISLMAFGALILNIVLSAFFVHGSNVSFEFVIIATLITYLVYVFALTIYGRKLIGIKFSLSETTKDAFPLRKMIPFSISFLLSILFLPDIYFLIPFILYVCLNFRDLTKIEQITKKVIKNPNFINI